MEVAVSVLGIVQAAFKTAKTLHDLAERYRGAKTMIPALQVQTTTIAWSLRSLHLVLDLKDPQTSDLVRRRFKELPELEENLEVAMAGCDMVLACLDAEIEDLVRGARPMVDQVKWKTKARWLWKDDTLRELLQSLQGMHASVLAIMQCFQVYVFTLFNPITANSH